MPPSRAAKKTFVRQTRAVRAPAHTRRPSITIIGAGRLGSALAVALERSGYRIDALVSTTRAHAGRSARLLQTPTLALAADELDQLPDSPLVVIATPDDQISATAARLAASVPQATRETHRSTDEKRVQNKARVNNRTRVAWHASGALSSRELAPLASVGFAVGSLHPLVSISDPASNADDFAGAYFCVEGDAAAVRAGRAVVRSLGGHAFTVAARDKSLYHAAALFAAGHVVALFDLSTELFARCGIPRAQARRIFLPLARSTADNLASAHAEADALTGPFSRADVATIRRHLDALGAPDAPPDALPLYALLGLRSLRLAAEKGVDPSRLTEIARALSPFVANDVFQILATEDTEITEQKKH
jgi:predicted short-subunit dehydrogenase-like oxidoreductase (DUF2520 family)